MSASIQTYIVSVIFSAKIFGLLDCGETSNQFISHDKIAHIEKLHKGAGRNWTFLGLNYFKRFEI